MTPRSPDEIVQCECCGRPFARTASWIQPAYRMKRCGACRAACHRGKVGRVCHVVEGEQ